MKRKPGALLPIEVSLLRAGIGLLAHGIPEFHGYAVAKEMKEADAARQLTAHGTLYRALDRMEEAGLVESLCHRLALCLRIDEAKGVTLKFWQLLDILWLCNI